MKKKLKRQNVQKNNLYKMVIFKILQNDGMKVLYLIFYQNTTVKLNYEYL